MLQLHIQGNLFLKEEVRTRRKIGFVLIFPKPQVCFYMLFCLKLLSRACVFFLVKLSHRQALINNNVFRLKSPAPMMNMCFFLAGAAGLKLFYILRPADVKEQTSFAVNSLIRPSPSISIAD
jgi:hypothetical protein